MVDVHEHRPDKPDSWEDWPSKAIDTKMTISYIVGRAGAHEDLAERLLDEAARHFREGEDEIAQYLRNELVPKIRKFAENNREKQVKNQKWLGEIFEKARESNG